jgi:UDP-N-acetylmuramoyl-tripeptide--D-alanyl-D-alanine ligase
MPVSTDEVAALLGATVAGVPADAVLTADVEVDSRRATPGSLFVALPGERSTGTTTRQRPSARGRSPR